MPRTSETLKHHPHSGTLSVTKSGAILCYYVTCDLIAASPFNIYTLHLLSHQPSPALLVTFPS